HGLSTPRVVRPVALAASARLALGARAIAVRGGAATSAGRGVSCSGILTAGPGRAAVSPRQPPPCAPHVTGRPAVARSPRAARGPTGCRYLASVERQREYVRDGWNLTGDSYVRDADGYFWYQARTDDIIISAGYNIAGPEVENVLLEHPAVAECAVIGAP